MDADVPPSMRRQCELLGVNRSSLYYEPVTPDAEELALMRRMDELHLKRPFYGSRMMTQTLKGEGLDVNRKRIQRLMRVMGLESLAPKPNTSKAAPEHAVYPYLLRNVKVPVTSTHFCIASGVSSGHAACIPGGVQSHSC